MRTGDDLIDRPYGDFHGRRDVYYSEVVNTSHRTR